MTTQVSELMHSFRVDALLQHILPVHLMKVFLVTVH